MKVEDLMVGNWVYHKNSKYPIKVGINDFKFSFDWATPIELTEKNIVDLLGFKRSLILRFLYCKNKITIDWYEKIITINGADIQLPKHVHKLQQLIKSLEE